MGLGELGLCYTVCIIQCVGPVYVYVYTQYVFAVLSFHRVKCGIILRILLSVYYFIRLIKSQIKLITYQFYYIIN